MNQADRILRIIFREMPFSHLLQDWKQLEKQPLSLGNPDFQERVCKAYLQVYPHNYSYDEVQGLIQTFCQEMEGQYDLTDKQKTPLYLFPIYGRKLFTLENNGIFVRFEELLEWDGFNSKVDPVIFQAAFLAGQVQNISCSLDIRHTEKRLYKILSQGAFETHMHMNGSGDSWEINWHNLACCPPITFFARWQQGELDDLTPVMAYQVQVLRTYFLAVAMYGGGNAEFPIEILKHMLVSGVERRYFDQRDFLRQIHRKYERFSPDFSQKRGAIFLKERYFLAQVFAQLERQKLSALEESLLTIYLGMMCRYRFCFVQDNNGMGFDKFQRNEIMKECFFSPEDDKKLLQSVLEKYYSEGFIEGIELRMAPKTKEKLHQKIQQIIQIHDQVYKAYQKNHPTKKKMKLGIIIHYIKAKDTQLDGECRHSILRHKVERESVALSRCFEGMQEKNQEISIIGVDAANGEIHCSPEIFAPVFRRHRQEIASKQPLGFTYHVGEDFLNLASGLRAIDDVLEFFNFTRGDRLGHAIALGTHVKRYLKSKRNWVIGTVQSMVDDYVWMYRMIANQPQKGAPDLLVRLERGYRRWAEQLFANVEMSVPDIMTYCQSYALRGDEPTYFKEWFHRGGGRVPKSYKMNAQNPKHQEAACSEAACKLYYTYHYTRQYRKNSQKSVTMEADNTYVEALQLAQGILRQKVYELGISIETNPTSNKRISYILAYQDLPLLAFNHRNLSLKKLGNKPDMQVSINTDDSAIFQTNLSNEYAYVAAALIRLGCAKEDVLSYVDHIRMLSKSTTFLDVDGEI